MNRDNDIRRAFQTKLSGYHPPLPADGWERIEQSVMQAAARRVIRRRWYAGTAAAMLTLLVGSLFFLRDPMVREGQMVSESGKSRTDGQMKPVRPAEAQRFEEFRQPYREPSVAAPALYASVSHRLQDRTFVRGITSVEMMEQWMQQEGISPGQPVNKQRPFFRAATLQAYRSTAPNIPENADEKITVSSPVDTLFAENTGDRADNGRLALSFGGKGGLTSFRQHVNSPMTLRNASVSAENRPAGEPAKNMLTSTRTVDNLSEMEHDQPVSFGVTISKSISGNLSVESGLTYTYLSSRAKNANANFRVQETQQIHYLGIPVNLNYDLFSLKKLNVYVSVGGMVEKDIYGEYRKLGAGETLDLNSSAREKEVTKISQHHPQLSVNAGAGLSYPLIQHLKLYGKVGGAFYFDAANEYKTIYSDRKIVLDLNFGLRYEF